MTIHLYGEHLVNIRTLSLQASLSTASNQETQATLSADGSVLSLAHEGEAASIQLPVRIPGGHSDATLTIPAAPTKNLTFRVSLSEKPSTSGFLTSADNNQDANVIPWTAASLTPETLIVCSQCGTVIVDRGTVKVWKDLPSENWAEMMDFWHCHRPDVSQHGHDRSVPKKGYSADSRLALESGVGMVDPVDFVIAADDTQNLQTVPSSTATSSPRDESLQCKNCRTIVGQVHPSSEGDKLRKQHLSISIARDVPPISYEAEKWLACHLLSSVESQGVRKFIVHNPAGAPETETALKLWIFTPDITVSSSAAKSPEPIRAVKILWEDCVGSAAAAVDSGMLNRQTLAEGELELPADEIACLHAALIRSGALLPENARTFQSWKVALLPRFTSVDDVHSQSQQPPKPAVFLPEVPDIQNKEILSALTS